MSKLAIDGGSKIFADDFTFAPWPPVYPEVAEKLSQVYLNHQWSFYGPRELTFSENFARYHDALYGTFMVNGTATLESALKALGVGPGDEVIVPSWTWMATGMAPLYVGATPVFVDGDPETFCMSPSAFEAAITPRTKAVMPVHLFGSMADIEEICSIAAKHGIYVIEDCAHAHGGKWNGKGVGSFGTVGSFSFQQSKIMTAGEGGMCITSDAEISDRLGRYSHIGYSRGGKQGKPATPPPLDLDSHNYRATEFQAVILQDQLERLEKASLRRQANADFLHAELNRIPGITTQKPGRCATMQSYYVFAVTVDPEILKEGKTKTDVVAAINAEGAPEVFEGWGAIACKQRLWNVSPDRYKLHSFETVENIINKRIILAGIQWLEGGQTLCEKLVETFAKVMEEYSK